MHGPALTFDTACSSGLLAVHMACRSLDGHESDLALAGGCMVMWEPRKNIWASAQGMLSPTGRCRAFDEAADGVVRSEGCAVVLLKRLPDALRDGDRILAVVHGTAANSDGRTRNIATPSVDAQVAACRAALAAGGVDADTIGAVEAHGAAPEKSCSARRSPTSATTESAAAPWGSSRRSSSCSTVLFPPALRSVTRSSSRAWPRHTTRRWCTSTARPMLLRRSRPDWFVPREITPWPTDGHAGLRGPRGFLTDLYSAGAAVHFSALYPGGYGRHDTMRTHNSST